MFGSGIFAGLPVQGDVNGVLYEGGHQIVLVENRANEVTVPSVKVGLIHTRLMAWTDAGNQFVAAGAPTRISEFVKQLNRRYLGSSALNPSVVQRCETVDADTGNRLVFTPGATPVGSLQDFEVIIADQDGDYESRGFLIFLAANANPGVLDAGEVVLRLTPEALPF